MSKITKLRSYPLWTADMGKSTLTNKLVGQKVAIVSSKPQTTRTRITGVLSRGETQYVLLDTPGLHKPRSRLGDYMCKVVTDTVSEVDVAVLVVEPIPNIGPAEENLIAQIKQHHMPAILVINKIDTVKKEELLAVIATYAAVHEFDAVVPISAPAGREELLTEIDNTPSKARSCSRRTWYPISRSVSLSLKLSARRCCACSTARFRTV
ncbi:MAG: GTPase Era [Butyricicoccaceae bacterium]